MNTKISMTLDVGTQAEAQELRAAWQEIVMGKKLTRVQALERDTAEIVDRAQSALHTIEGSLRDHPHTGQAGRLVRFLAAIYNGWDYDFDLTDLRVLDDELATACLDYLNYDRLNKREVHKHLTGGDRQLHRWIADYALPPHLALSQDQVEDFAKLMGKTGRSPSELLSEAIGLLLDHHSPTPSVQSSRK